MVLMTFNVSGAEFTQGMILPTANGVAKPHATSQSKAKMDKTQVGADDLLQPSATFQAL